MRITRFTCATLGKREKSGTLTPEDITKKTEKETGQVQVVNPKEKIAGAAAGVDATAKEGISGATAYDTPFHLLSFSGGQLSKLRITI